MKNIHILPTENKWSRLYFNINDREYQICENEKTSTVLKPNRHIYITSDEEIKEGDYILIHGHYRYGKHVTKVIKITDTYEVIEGGNHSKKVCQKIIITTDQHLIKDGVQAIDDEFLEWFVKNPSCEEVEIANDLKYFNVDELRERHLKGLPHLYSESIGYKIIIPQEELKQIKCYCGHTSYCDCSPLEEPKQETLEQIDQNNPITRGSTALVKQETLEEREPYWDLVDKKAEQNNTIDLDAYAKGVQDGAKWQMDKQDSFTISFVEWLNEIQSFHSGENAYYFQGKWYSYKEILEFYKNMFPR